jgi:hypothetical protein
VPSANNSRNGRNLMHGSLDVLHNNDVVPSSLNRTGCWMSAVVFPKATTFAVRGRGTGNRFFLNVCIEVERGGFVYIYAFFIKIVHHSMGPLCTTMRRIVAK